MDVQSLKIGRPLSVTVSRDKFIYHLVSTVEAVEGRTIYVTLITGKSGNPFQFMPDDKITILYRMEDRLWRWKQVTGGLDTLEGDPVHTLKVKFWDGESYNRREAYRVYIGEETDLSRRVPDLEKIKAYRREHPEIKDISELLEVEECYKILVTQCLIKDLSETGIGLYSSDKLPEDSEVQISLPTEFGRIEIQCVPVRNEIDSNSRFRYFYGCRLTSVSNNIVKILFNLQRVQLNKLRGRT